jgi:MFS family permease
LLWIVSTISGAGEFVYTVAASWLMLTLTGSPLWVGGVVAARTVPMLLATPFAGSVADARDRRTILLAAHAAMLTVALTMSVLTWERIITAPVLLGLIVVLGFATAFNAPAWHAFLPDVVPTALIPSAVALQSAAGSMAAAIGPPVGGVLLSLAGPAPVFLVNGFTYLPVMAVLFVLRTPAMHASLRGPALAGFFEALRVAWRRGFGRWYAVAACFASASGAVAATLPSISRTLGGAGTFGVLYGLSGVGTVVGATVRRQALRFVALRFLSLALLGEALALGVIALPLGYVGVVAGMVAAGVFGLWGSATLESRVQLATSRETRGRLMGAYLFVFLGALALTSLGSGLAASFVGPRPVLGSVAVVLAVVASFSLADRVRMTSRQVLS